MAPTDQLARSFFDLWHHLDPVAAGRFDPEAPPPSIGGFDGNGVREHVAALRALAAGALELDLGSKDDEVDRTILLTAIGAIERRFADGGPYRTDPSFWLARMGAALGAPAQEPDLLAAIPATLELAQATLRKPAPVLLDLAAEQLPLIQALVESNPRAGSEDQVRARSALLEFGSFLRQELAATADPASGTLGSDAVDSRLRNELGLEISAGAALRQLARQAETLEAELTLARAGRTDARSPAGRPDHDAVSHELTRIDGWLERLGLGPVPGSVRVASLDPLAELVEPTGRVTLEPGGALEAARVWVEVPTAWPIPAAAVGGRHGRLGEALGLLARRGARSDVRRRYVSPAWLGGFGGFALDWLFHQSGPGGTDERAVVLGERLFAVLVAAVDLSIHLGQLDPRDAEARLGARGQVAPARVKAAVRGVLAAPLERAGAVLLEERWNRMAGTVGGEPARFAVRVAELGILEPTVAGWSLDLPS